MYGPRARVTTVLCEETFQQRFVNIKTIYENYSKSDQQIDTNDRCNHNYNDWPNELAHESVKFRL